MIVSINQPAYLPWAGYFHRIALSNLHIVLDDVQFEKNSFTNRNKIRTKQGWSWLTVPVRIKGRTRQFAISQVEIGHDLRWPKKHWDSLRFNYGKAPYFNSHARFFEGIYRQRWRFLADLIRETTQYQLNAFGIGTRIRFSSEMDVEGKKTDRLVNLCRKVGATAYLSGPLGKNYLVEDLFAAAGIKVLYHNFRGVVYPQVFSGFEPRMGAVDLLFNCGPRSLEILMADKEAAS